MSSTGTLTPPPAMVSADSALQRERRRLASFRYYALLTVLVASALGMQILATALGHYFRKSPVPLKKPLARMDHRALLPEYELHVQPPPALSDEVIETLGTRDFLQWVVVDRQRSRSDPLCVANVFISYYTGKPDQVPHVPEECMQAGGFRWNGQADTVSVAVSGLGPEPQKIPVRALQFEGGGPIGGLSAERPRFDVFYFFISNWDFMTTRTEVRIAQANLIEKYAYYAKIEVKFTDYDRIRSSADRAESIRALEPLLSKIIPMLMRDHIPARSELEAQATPQGDRR